MRINFTLSVHLNVLHKNVRLFVFFCSIILYILYIYIFFLSFFRIRGFCSSRCIFYLDFSPLTFSYSHGIGMLTQIIFYLVFLGLFHWTSTSEKFLLKKMFYGCLFLLRAFWDWDACCVQRHSLRGEHRNQMIFTWRSFQVFAMDWRVSSELTSL